MQIPKIMASKVRIFAFCNAFLIFTFSFLILSKVKAHCPLCVAGAGAGLSLSRLLGIDDSITGVWLGAFLGAISFWTETLIKKRFLKGKSGPKSLVLLRPLLYLGIFLSSLWSFYKFNLVNKHAGNIFGIDKLTFGIVSGGILFYLVDMVDDAIIKRKGKVLFPYQRIIVSLGSILVLSLAVFILINYII